MNPERTLVDSSAWIASFRMAGNSSLKEHLIQCIQADLAVTTPIILLELVQGCRTERERDDLMTMLGSLGSVPINGPVWEESYGLGYALRRDGLTIPTADLVIAAAAIVHDCILLHLDDHYDMIGRHSRLKTRTWPRTT